MTNRDTDSALMQGSLSTENIDSQGIKQRLMQRSGLAGLMIRGNDCRPGGKARRAKRASDMGASDMGASDMGASDMGASDMGASDMGGRAAYETRQNEQVKTQLSVQANKHVPSENCRRGREGLGTSI